MNLLILTGIILGTCLTLINRFVKDIPKWADIIITVLFIVAVLLIVAGMIKTRLG